MKKLLSVMIAALIAVSSTVPAFAWSVDRSGPVVRGAGNCAEAGHIYVSELVTPLGATTDGVIRAECQICGDVQTVIVPAGEWFVKYECPSSPVGDPPLSRDSNWYAPSWNDIFYGESGDLILNPDGSPKTTYRVINGELVFDLTTIESGTWFQTNNQEGSFSYKYSFKLVPEAYDDYFSPNDEPSEYYTQGLYNVFGGIMPEYDHSLYGIRYAAGFFPSAPGSTIGTFRIIENAQVAAVVRPEVLEARGEEPKRVFCETDPVDLGTGWHDVIFVFDETVGAAFYYLDGECIMAAWNEDFSMSGNKQVQLIREMEVPCMIKDMGIGTTTAFFEGVCAHDYGTERVNITPATCTAPGSYDERCLRCRRIIATGLEIPPEHKPERTEVAPTCTNNGMYYVVCTACGEYLEAGTIPAVGHTPIGREEIPATCTAAGISAGEICYVCGEVLTGCESIPPLGHDFSEEYTIDIQPTKTEPGMKSRHCTRCDSTSENTEVLYLLGEVNADGVVNVKDIVCLKKLIAGNYPSSQVVTVNCDIDNDDFTSIKDITAIKKLVSGQ